MDNRTLARVLYRRLLKAVPAELHERYALPGGTARVRDVRDVVAKALAECRPRTWRFRTWDEVRFLGMVFEFDWFLASWWTPTPAETTDFEPGSAEKVAVMAGRAERGEELFAAGDAVKRAVA